MEAESFIETVTRSIRTT